MRYFGCWQQNGREWRLKRQESAREGERPARAGLFLFSGNPARSPQSLLHHAFGTHLYIRPTFPPVIQSCTGIFLYVHQAPFGPFL